LLKTVLAARLENATTEYTVKRVTNLITFLLIVVVALSLSFVNWYATIVSLGLVSLILGMALQNPLTSFFAWIYILLTRPYRVGDRIRIGEVRGDVIELSYLTTTLWEFNGDYLSGDHPSGRIIRFANAKVFSEYVLNYSWPLFPYLWNEIVFYVAYESDLAYVSETCIRIAEENIGQEMMRRVRLYRNILAETPVDELQVQERPSVLFRAHANTWIEVVVRYLVGPKESGRVKNLLFRQILEQLSLHPEKVLFPKDNAR